MQQHHAHVDHI